LEVFSQRVLHLFLTDGRGFVNSTNLPRVPQGARVQVAGLIIVYQPPPTARRFQFLTLEDEYSFFNIIIRPKLYARYRRVIQSTPLLFVEGSFSSRERC
jgi:error-prone DNA polymerase